MTENKCVYFRSKFSIIKLSYIKVCTYFIFWSTSVGTITRPLAGGPGFESWQGQEMFVFSKLFGQVL